MKQRIIGGLAGAVLALSLVSAGSVAYFSSTQTVRQVITTGSIQIVLNEEAGPAVPVMPGSVLHRPVSISNVGENAAWVRVKVLGKWDVVGIDTGSEIAPVPDYDMSAWVLRDGWYYLSEKLESGTTSAKLFTSLMFPLSLNDAYQGHSYHLTLQAEAVQAANNATTALEAEGWAGQ